MHDSDSRGIAFVGLGDLGQAMALHLLETGWRLRVHDRSPGKVESLVAAGATAAGTDLVGDVAFVCLAVPDDHAVLSLVDGPDGLAERMRPGQSLLVHSTILPTTARDLASRLAERTISFVDAPVSGGSGRARSGELAVFVGASADDLETARPLLDAIAQNVFHLGPAGAGSATKLANQLVTFASLGAVHEGLALTRSFGVADDAVLGALSAGLGDTWVGRNWGFFDRTVAAYDAGGTPVSERPWSKDLREVVAAARAAGLETPLAELLAERLADVVEESAHTEGTGDSE